MYKFGYILMGLWLIICTILAISAESVEWLLFFNFFLFGVGFFLVFFIVVWMINRWGE
ncbi:hypothetical protein [Salirhabdus salicampi]|uniref:hypothetical protein n=1 Tax=Salirhabdus salicampi TaxID=476102 RepID=UPI0020C1BC5A|nr:hypothetical protein [Salirhabdus salicampi]MCP8615775.1 hypothetical protein [Salirhabdus salicampi]